MVLLVLAAGQLAAFGYKYVHEVMPGESLAQIAKRYRISVDRLRRINRIKSARLRAGQKLRIVSSVPARIRYRRRYVVRKGDTLSGIAKRFRTSVRVLQHVNRGRLGRLLRPGQKLMLVMEAPAKPGNLKNLYRIDAGPGYAVRNPKRSWGTFLAVRRLHDVLTAYRERYPDGERPRIHDLSQRGGGYLPPHVSHRTGRDVDVPYPLRGKRFGPATSVTLDLRRMWFLLSTFVATKDVDLIFMDYRLQRALYKYAQTLDLPAGTLDNLFQYPRGKSVRGGLIRHEPGHATHFHVRFRAEKKPAPPVS